MSDDDDASAFNRAMDANRGHGRPYLAYQSRTNGSRSNGQGHLPVDEPYAARERRLQRVLWWDADDWNEVAIPPRPWIARPLLMRRAVTALAGPGSGGKSSLMLSWACALALGLPYRPIDPLERYTVLVYNVEDDQVEQQRRLSAALRQFDSKPADVKNWIVRCGPHDIGTLIELDPITGGYVMTEAWEGLEFVIQQHKPAVVMLDPIVELHTAEENDNTAMRGIFARFRVLAMHYDCAVVLIHHTRKGAVAGDMEGIRGASALNGACRIVLTAFPMTEDEAVLHDVAPNRRREYFRLDPVKQNYAPQTDPYWHELRSYPIANGEDIAAAVPWTPPSLFRDLSAADCNRALDLIAAGPVPGTLFTAVRRGPTKERWAGNVLLEHFSLPESQAARIIRAWVQSGLLVEAVYQDPQQRRERKGVNVVDAKRPTTTQAPGDEGYYNSE